MIAANPVVIILVFSSIGIYLLTKFTISIIVVVLVTSATEKSIFVLLHSWSYFFVYFFWRAKLIKAFSAGRNVFTTLFVAILRTFCNLFKITLGDIRLGIRIVLLRLWRYILTLLIVLLLHWILRIFSYFLFCSNVAYTQVIFRRRLSNHYLLFHFLIFRLLYGRGSPYWRLPFILLQIDGFWSRW